MRVRVVLMLALMLAAASVAAAQGEAPPAQSQAWTTSIAAEAAGDLPKARQIMVAAYGEHPESYQPCVRLAWLSLQLNRGREATELYRRARQLPGALPEATQGLVLALVRAGYEELDRGDVPDARRNWQEALRLSADQADAKAGLDLVGPSTGIAPEVWAGRLTSSSNTSTAGVTYVQVPVRLNDHISVRGIVRNIMSPGAATGKTSVFQSQQEFYGGVAIEQGMASIEVIGLQLRGASGNTSGGAVSVRAGGHAGATVTVSGQHDSTGWNTQWLPQAFVWVTPNVALAGGLRVTSAPSTSSVSGIAGATVKARAWQIDVQAHGGTEQSAFSIAGPTILSFTSSTTGGGVGTVACRITPTTTAFAQVQIEQLSGGVGQYSSIAAGVRWSLDSKSLRAQR